MSRYQRQVLLPQIGAAGQARLAESRVLLVGCGALGCHVADQMARAGIGWLRIADRDVVEETNLQRQSLFDESDAKVSRAKAEAAWGRLSRVNSSIKIEPMVVDVWAGNIEQLIDFEGKRPSLILDGTDNVQTRYLLNDVSVKFGIPWIHAACVGTEGRVMVIEPGRGGGGACLRCVFPTPPAAGELPTCDTAGVLQAAAAATASLQGAQAIKLLTSNPGISPSLGTPGEGRGGGQRLWKLDVWSGRFTSIDLSDARHAECPCCGRREFPFLSGDTSESALTLCGRNAVQIRPSKPWNPLQFEQACRRLGTIGRVESGAFFSRCRLDDPPGMTITCFRDGRLLIDGTADAGRAKSICARYLGA